MSNRPIIYRELAMMKLAEKRWLERSAGAGLSPRNRFSIALAEDLPRCGVFRSKPAPEARPGQPM